MPIPREHSRGGPLSKGVPHRAGSPDQAVGQGPWEHRRGGLPSPGGTSGLKGNSQRTAAL